MEELCTKLSEKLDGYERILAKQPYLAGNEISLADLFVSRGSPAKCKLTYQAHSFILHHDTAFSRRALSFSSRSRASHPVKTQRGSLVEEAFATR